MPRHFLDKVASLSVAIVAALVLSGCGFAGAGTPSNSTPKPTSFEPATRQALLRIAVQFNNDYAANVDGPVYDRWDALSQEIITRAQYVRRHAECPTAPGSAVVEGANRANHGYWRVDYSIDGTQLVDYWHYVKGRWRFNLQRSNPQAVTLYRLSFGAYAAAVGCRPSL